MALCRTWNRTNKRLADEVEFDGGGRARGQQTIGDFWQCVLESNVAIFIHVLECCMGDMYW